MSAILALLVDWMQVLTPILSLNHTLRLFIGVWCNLSICNSRVLNGENIKIFGQLVRLGRVLVFQ